MLIEADEIMERLWQGSIPPRGRKLSREGFDMVVLCSSDFQFPASDFPGVEVVHAPYEDNILTPDARALVLEAADRVAFAYRQGKKVLVTCTAGLNRSGYVMGMALHLIFGWEGNRCVGLIRRQRSNPSMPLLKPLFNQDFENALLALPQRTAGALHKK